jgi:pimeloyl-ACP methyl ester carboxylesterase
VTTPVGTRRRSLRVDNIELSILEAGAPDQVAGSPDQVAGAQVDGASGARPLVVLCHGFPELAFSWRHQFDALAAAGWHVVAPDQRGYGQSDRPADQDAYDIDHLTDDLAGLIAALGHERAVMVGHDWGAIVVWSMAQRLPDRVAAVAGLSVPLVPRPSGPPTQILRAVLQDRFFYMLFFQEPGVAEADLGADVATTMRRFLAGLAVPDDATTQHAGEQPAGAPGAGPLDDLLGPDDGRGMIERMPEPAGLPEWLSQDELDAYVAAFDANGFTGPLNWYRNLDRNWERSAAWGNRTVTCPSLFIGGSADPVLLMSPPATGHALLADHRGDVLVPGAGHWVQQERPPAVNDALLDFLSSPGVAPTVRS